MKIHHASAAAAVSKKKNSIFSSSSKKKSSTTKEEANEEEEDNGETRSIENKELMGKAMLETTAAKIESKTGHIESATGKRIFFHYKLFLSRSNIYDMDDGSISIVLQNDIPLYFIYECLSRITSSALMSFYQ